ncbi:MAG: hypothetical protein IJN07_02000 [Clostridia bacterium]|nr:hypothetical protein [Clostridia bacterium]
MKKITVLLLSIIMMLGVFAGAFSASAATTEEALIEKISASPIYKYIEGDVKNLARTIDATPEQLDKLSVIADKFVALKLTDKGGSASEYTADEMKAVMALVKEAADVMEYTYTFTDSKSPKHKDDLVITLYDKNNKVVYSFDGDAVKKTGADQTVLFALIAVLGCGLLAGAVVARRKATGAAK